MKTIKLSDGASAIIDDEDFERVSQFNWHHDPHGAGYARRNIKLPDGRWSTQYLHRFIINAEGGVYVDHKSGDSLDNRKENLRPATMSQNLHNCGLRKTNTSGVRGVIWCKREQNWRAEIMSDGKRKRLGQFKEKADAAAAYAAADKELHGEFSKH